MILPYMFHLMLYSPATEAPLENTYFDKLGYKLMDSIETMLGQGLKLPT